MPCVVKGGYDYYALSTLLNYITPDVVQMDGRIVASVGPDLAVRLEQEGHAS